MTTRLGFLLLSAIAFLLAPSARAQATWPANGHTYQFVPFAGNWPFARAAAESMIYNGQPGYLATISTSGENNFLIISLSDVLEATAWIGASDAGSDPLTPDPFAEGTWQWLTGPEAGIQFWSGPALPVGGPTPPFFYANWRPFIEPNDFGGEDFAEWALGDWGGIVKGEWIDSDINGTNANVVGFIVEFGSPFHDVGAGLAGVSGIPSLVGAGTLITGEPGALTLSSAAPSTLALLFTSLSSNPTPFKCGTLVPVPWTVTLSLATNGVGAIPLTWPAWPAGLSGLSLYWQYAVQDAAAICGASLSNALRADVP